MADDPSKGIPNEASDAFGEALILLVQCKGGAEEPTVMLDGQFLRMSMVFGRVAIRGTPTCCQAGCATCCLPTHGESQRVTPSWLR
jgi:hypothetical protein